MNYEAFYNKVGTINGWDFSHVRTKTIGVEWDFFDEVKKQCKPDDIILDIGTGGGENLLAISSAARLFIGIDQSEQMIEKAQQNAEQAKVNHVKFMQMNAEKLVFPTGFFDLVSTRHAPFCANEVASVLKSGGIFMTQQVSENDKRNIIDYFKRGQATERKDGELQRQYVEALSSAGFSKVDVATYDATEYYERPEDLLFLLKHTPIIPHFGEDPKDYEILAQFIEEHTRENGIVTNSKRFMIKAIR